METPPRSQPSRSVGSHASDGECDSERSTRGLVSGAGIVVLAGLALPVAWGWAPPLAALVLLMGVAHARRSAAWREAASAGGWSAVLARLGTAQRVTLAALVGLPIAVLCTVAARGLGAVLIAFPAAAWGIVPLGVGIVAIPRVQGRARGALVLVLALAVPLAGVLGARWESAGAEARGWAHSGPILGIHPFQATAVIVDGWGPYDLPINDYVEPDGSRGYGPAELADALERALHEIAVRHFEHGPARARRAFADARVEATTTDPVRERLDREPSDATQSRILVSSGTTGQRSRVQFVCPGKQDDPSGLPEEAVLSRMCPNKYISEASAGLGLTGRWTGYAEGRGNERFGLSRALGWTRSDDELGRKVVAREVRWWAWLGLGLAALLGVLAAPRRAQALHATTAALFVAVLVVAIALVVVAGPSLRVGAFEQPPAWVDLFTPRAWLPMVVAFSGALTVVGAGPPRPGRAVHRIPAAAVALGTLAVAAFVHADAWVRPDLAGTDRQLPFEALVLAAAESTGERMGLGILEIEGAIAAVVAALLVGALVGWAHTASAASTRLWPSVAAAGRMGGAMVLVVAAALVVSRKTDGAAALIPAAMAAILVLGSALSVLGSAHRERGRSWRALVHVAWVALGVAVLLRSAEDLPAHPFVTLCVVVGLVTLAGGLTLLLRPNPHRAPRTPPRAEASVPEEPS